MATFPPLALVGSDEGGGFNVIDSRTSLALAWRGDIESAAAEAAHLNARYPAGTPAPAHDSLVFEIAMKRIGDNSPSLLELIPCKVIPGAIDDGPALWKPIGGDPQCS